MSELGSASRGVSPEAAGSKPAPPTGETGGGPLPAEGMVECVDCLCEVAVKESCSTGGSRSKTRRCRLCHNAKRACHSWYQRMGRGAEWEGMSREEKRVLTVRNKEKGAGRGAG